MRSHRSRARMVKLNGSGELASRKSLLGAQLHTVSQCMQQCHYSSFQPQGHSRRYSGIPSLRCRGNRYSSPPQLRPSVKVVVATYIHTCPPVFYCSSLPLYLGPPTWRGAQCISSAPALAVLRLLRSSAVLQCSSACGAPVL